MVDFQRLISKQFSIHSGYMNNQPITACKQYCLAAGATQGKIAYTQTVGGNIKKHYKLKKMKTKIFFIICFMLILNTKINSQNYKTYKSKFLCWGTYIL
jgi:hypothetical protein